MEDIVRGTLAGIAIGGFAAAMVGANRILMQAFWCLNCLAAETAWVMAKAPLEQMIIREQQRWVEDEYDSAEDSDDEDED